MIKAIVFDMDGVLIDSEPAYHRADEKLFAELGIPFGAREIAAMTGANNLVIAGLIVDWHPHLAPRRDELAVLYENAIFQGLCAEVTELFPGAMQWVVRAKEMGLKVGIGSSSSNRMVFHVADTFGLKPLMDTIVTGEMIKLGKPNPDIYLRACKDLGLPPEVCVAVEDSPNGLKAGRAAGMLCAAFHGTNRHGLDLSECDMAFDAYTDEAWERLLAL